MIIRNKLFQKQMFINELICVYEEHKQSLRYTRRICDMSKMKIMISIVAIVAVFAAITAVIYANGSADVVNKQGCKGACTVKTYTDNLKK